MRLLLLLLVAVPVFAADESLTPEDVLRLYQYDTKLEQLHEQELLKLHNENRELQRKLDALRGRSVCT